MTKKLRVGDTLATRKTHINTTYLRRMKLSIRGLHTIFLVEV